MKHKVLETPVLKALLKVQQMLSFQICFTNRHSYMYANINQFTSFTAYVYTCACSSFPAVKFYQYLFHKTKQKKLEVIFIFYYDLDCSLFKTMIIFCLKYLYVINYVKSIIPSPNIPHYKHISRKINYCI